VNRSWSGGTWNHGSNNWGHHGDHHFDHDRHFDHDHRFFYGGWPWYWGGYPYYGGYYPYYDSYSYDSGYNYNSTPDNSYSTPAYPSTSLSEVNTTTTQTWPAQPAIDDNAVFIGIRVPENAEIWIDGAKTARTGTYRQYVTPPLESGPKYTYDIRARWTENGKEVVRDRKLTFFAGDRLMVNLRDPAKKTPSQTSPVPQP
jgi:uncharacterized protein (TIGR03000 family)